MISLAYFEISKIELTGKFKFQQIFVKIFENATITNEKGHHGGAGQREGEEGEKEEASGG